MVKALGFVPHYAINLYQFFIVIPENRSLGREFKKKARRASEGLHIAFVG